MIVSRNVVEVTFLNSLETLCVVADRQLASKTDKTDGNKEARGVKVLGMETCPSAIAFALLHLPYRRRLNLAKLSHR